jgi:signal peptidase II
MRRSNAGLFWPVIIIVAVLDFVTKLLAKRILETPHLAHEVMMGDWVQFTLIYNSGAAFGLHVGQYSRWIFMALTLVALVILGRLYRGTRPGDLPRTLALALVCGGAVGNLLDRIRSAKGVIDFIDIGFGDSRWPTFNVADVAVSCGAFLLAWVLWEEDRAAVAVPGPAPVPAESGEVT